MENESYGFDNKPYGVMRWMLQDEMRRAITRIKYQHEDRVRRESERKNGQAETDEDTGTCRSNDQMQKA